MTLPGFQEAMFPVPKLAGSRDEVLPTGRLVEKVEAFLGPDQAERGQLLPSGKRTVIANRTHRAVAYLAKTGGLATTSSLGRTGRSG